MLKQFALATVLLSTTAAFAATSGTLLLKSVVPKVFSLSVNAATIASTLPLETTQSNSTVAQIAIKSNTLSGYKITISSANTGKLVHETTTSSTIPYTMKYDNTNVNLTTGSTLNFPASRPVDKLAPVQISYTGVPHSNLKQGEYADTVTFTISSI